MLGVWFLFYYFEKVGNHHHSIRWEVRRVGEGEEGVREWSTKIGHAIVVIFADTQSAAWIHFFSFFLIQYMRGS